jgi:hypothetical protein
MFDSIFGAGKCYDISILIIYFLGIYICILVYPFTIKNTTVNSVQIYNNIDDDYYINIEDDYNNNNIDGDYYINEIKEIKN